MKKIIALIVLVFASFSVSVSAQASEGKQTICNSGASDDWIHYGELQEGTIVPGKCIQLKYGTKLRVTTDSFRVRYTNSGSYQGCQVGHKTFSATTKHSKVYILQYARANCRH